MSEVTSEVMSRSHGACKKPNKPQLGQPLTRREREVLGLLSEGLTGRQVAERLFVEPSTVGFHSANAYVKLGAHTLLGALKAMGKPPRDENQAER